jgi:hypothetical protein
MKTQGPAGKVLSRHYMRGTVPRFRGSIKQPVIVAQGAGARMQDLLRQTAE